MTTNEKIRTFVLNLSNDLPATNRTPTKSEQEIEQEIEESMNAQNEIKTIHEYFMDDRREGRRSYNSCLPVHVDRFEQNDEERVRKRKNEVQEELKKDESIKKEDIQLFSKKKDKNEQCIDKKLRNGKKIQKSTNILEISIPKYTQIKNKTFYEVIIITNLKSFPSCHTRILKRYTHFLELKKKVKKFLKTTIEFPKKKWFFLKLSEEEKNERKNMLSMWMKYVFSKGIDNENLMNELRQFVMDEEKI